MFACTLFLVTALTLVRAAVPPYVQSREAFSHARTYISQMLTPDVGDIHDPDTRTHFSFGIIAGVTAALVLADKNATNYHPLLIMENYVPYSWMNYGEISRAGQMVLNEASQKVQPIANLIDVLCDSESIAQCNAKVHANVVRNQRAYKLPAELLLQVGKASEAVIRLEPKITAVTEDRHEIPFLLDNVDTKEFKALVAELQNAFIKMRQLQFRRYNPEFE